MNLKSYRRSTLEPDHLHARFAVLMPIVAPLTYRFIFCRGADRA
jgi:hypothetical protein